MKSSRAVGTQRVMQGPVPVGRLCVTASIETFFLKVPVAIEVLDLLARVIEDKPKKKIRSGPQPSTSEHSPCRAACMCNLHRLNFPLEIFFFKKKAISRIRPAKLLVGFGLINPKHKVK